MKITYWSDYACPYCYIGEARLRKAASEMGIKIEYAPKAFELDPMAPVTVQSDTPSRFAAKYRMSLQEAEAQIEHISQLGRKEGIDFNYKTTQYTNTFDAHRLMKYALSTGDLAKADKTNELLFAAYFTRNLRLAEKAVLLEVAQMAGLDMDKAKAVLESDQFGAEVRADEREAAQIGIHGVPYFIFPGGFSIPGAMSVSDFKNALTQGMANAGNAMKCGPDSCSL